MSSAPAIRVAGLGKRYRLSHRGGARYLTLRERLADGVRSLFARSAVPAAPDEEFWALRNAAFEVAPGERLGIVGRNGAGKSTLLKLLARITEPTTGRIELRGRVASLLEVGTGFHPELTGRENIFLNGAILGMHRAEIRRKFDEIVAFAETERFLDTPVKRYSSGMFVRLAFAVAAHLEPEILLVDEVLAVGDAAFQQKCQGKLGEVSRSGRTILFVSHNLTAVAAFCTRCLHLRAGELIAAGPTAEVLAGYAQEIAAGGREAGRSLTLGTDLTARIRDLAPAAPTVGGPLRFAVVVETPRTDGLRLEELCVIVRTPVGQRVGLIDLRRSEGIVARAGAPLRFDVSIPQLGLVEGDYQLGLWARTVLGDRDVADCATLSVLPAPRGEGPLPYDPALRAVVDFRETVTVKSCTADFR